MKLYQVKADGGRWYPTQAIAKAAARELKFQGAVVEQIDVPTTDGREALCGFLNNLQADAALTVEVAQGIAEQRAVETDHMSEEQFARFAESKPEPLPSIKQNWEAGDIEDFILNRATQAQVENIFSCLGARFAENRKG